MSFFDKRRRRKQRKPSRAGLDGKPLCSCPCTQAQLQSDKFQRWAARMHEQPMFMHRKIWENCYIAQALQERGMLAPGRQGLGFAVGQEPLSALFASLGCEIIATDAEPTVSTARHWVENAQHADSLEVMNLRGVCMPELFRERVRFRFADMRYLPDSLGEYDFIWSACALEHLSTMALGEEFIYQSLKYLKPGGVAVHTTEFNVSSNFWTWTTGTCVMFRRRDIQRVAHVLRQRGYKVELDFNTGDLPYDHVIDKPRLGHAQPYKQEIHLKFLLDKYVVTSFGLIIEKTFDVS